jgi:hypothetical protein
VSVSDDVRRSLVFRGVAECPGTLAEGGFAEGSRSLGAVQNHLFPGISLNGQLLTLEGPAAENQCEQQCREQKEFFHVTLEES